MTMVFYMITVPAGEFKAKCLQLMDLSHKTREIIVVTKRGVPIAKLVPYEDNPPSLFGFLRGTINIKGDIVASTGEEWDATSESN